ncbi:MAG TPA: hypothetical protein VGN16_16750 [Acidobacteriaceae bacterium]|jgi:hypothetical protein
MKRYATLLLAILALPAAVLGAQAPPPSQDVSIHADGRCHEVRPGDTVHYSLTVKGLENVRAVYADLQMRPGREFMARPAGLPSPDFRSLGGGGQAKPDASTPDVFQFSFVVPKEIYSGVYRGIGVLVRTDEPADPYGPPARVDVTHHTEKQARRFCLTVVSNFGEQHERPEVTNFRPGAIDRK